MYTSAYYVDRGNKTLFWDVYSRTVVICFGCIYQSITWDRGDKTLFWDVYIRVLPGPW